MTAILGTSGDDVLQGGNGADFIRGEEGNDTLSGGDGNDVIDGGTGNDTIHGEAGGDRMYGREGNDTIYGGLGADVLAGGEGNNRLYGGDGDDRVRGGNDIDVLWGEAGDDTLFGYDGDDRIAGGSGADYLVGGQGTDVLNGGGGSDRLSGGGGHDTILGGTGNDIATGDGGNDTFTGGAGDDRFTGGAGQQDRAIFSGSYADYQVQYFAGSGMVIVTDIRSGSPDGADRLFTVEMLEFSNGVVLVNGGNFDLSGLEQDGDLPADITTPATLALGETISSELEATGDRDWIAVDLVAGQRYAISLTGSGDSPLSDPLVRLYDGSGNLVAENDDGGAGLNSLLNYTVQSTGTYYVEAAAWNDSVAGTYTVGLETAEPLEAWTNDQIADYLSSGYWVGNGASARHWDVTDGGTITVSLVGLTADGQTLARAALALWSDLTGITFSEVGVGGQMTFDDDEDGAFSSSTISGGFITSAEVNVSTDWISTYGTNLDSYSYQTFIHEIGHALGLGHSGPYNGAADYAVDAAYLNDSWQASIMSYFSQTENTYVDASYAFVVSPQVADILAIQDMYGLAGNIRGGDTVYGFNSTAGNAIYDATSFTRVTSYTIVDTGGTDTMDYSGSNANQTLDLRAESFSSLQGGRGNVAIARGSVIENAIGGTGNDTLIGNSADNELTGNGGNDTFYASGGTDVYNGNGGSDTVVFSGLQTDYSVTTNGSGNTVVTDLRVNTPDGVTELISIETIEYGTSAPSLTAALTPGTVADLLVQDAGDGFTGQMSWDRLFVHDGDFRGLVPGWNGGAFGLQVFGEFDGASLPVMRLLDSADLDRTMPSIGLAVMDVLDGHEDTSAGHGADDFEDKHAAHHHVMPDLSPEEIAQIQFIDTESDVIGQALNNLTYTSPGDNGEDLPFDMTGIHRGVDGLLTLSELDEVANALARYMEPASPDVLAANAHAPDILAGLVDSADLMPQLELTDLWF
ncbi:M10 family metallopeptidase C-terminal domain-containing protein [Maricaulis sp.]|uniref:M10 family metallopeptidase C-terminal domain-containing protein n=1 Tax=Maricaulis sp. TaxID=1486257 RepID=UPI003A90433F